MQAIAPEGGCPSRVRGVQHHLRALFELLLLLPVSKRGCSPLTVESAMRTTSMCCSSPLYGLPLSCDVSYIDRSGARWELTPLIAASAWARHSSLSSVPHGCECHEASQAYLAKTGPLRDRPSEDSRNLQERIMP